jgi:hypothetical protein
MYSSYTFLTSALDGAEWLVSRPGCTLPPVPIEQEAVWATELSGPRGSLSPARTDWAAPGPLIFIYESILALYRHNACSWNNVV